MTYEVSNKVKMECLGFQFIASTKELLEYSTFKPTPETTHHYPECEICSKKPDTSKPDEVWFVGYKWGEWYSIFICEECIVKIKNMIDDKNSKKYMR